MNNGNQASKQCPHCQAVNSFDAPFCQTCSHPFGNPYQHPPSNYAPHSQPGYVPQGGSPTDIQVPPGSHPVVLVVVLSLLFGGWVGMLINRQYVKGLVFGMLVGGIVTVVTCGMGAIIWYPLTVIDAILVANKLNRGERVKEWQFF